MSFKRQHIAPIPLNPLNRADEYSDFSFAVGLARYCDLPRTFEEQRFATGVIFSDNSA